MKKLILLLLFIPLLSFSQDLQVQWFDTDQRDETIKAVFITDEDGTERVKDFEAKSSVDLIDKFEAKGYKVFSIDHILYPVGSMKYIVWFTKEIE